MRRYISRTRHPGVASFSSPEPSASLCHLAFRRPRDITKRRALGTKMRVTFDCLSVILTLTNQTAWFVSSFCTELPLFCTLPENSVSLSKSEQTHFSL